MNEQLAAIKARREAISHMVRDTTTRRATAYNERDAAFIAAAPADITALLAMVDALTGELAAANAALAQAQSIAQTALDSFAAANTALAAERDAAKRHAAYIASCVDECGSYIP